MTMRLKLVLGFAVIYGVWGSTYLAIRFAVETVPPFMLMGVRFFIAGALLSLPALGQTAPALKPRDWGMITLQSLTMVVFGVGVVGWVEQFIPSGLCALLISISPIWLVVIDSLAPGGRKPGWRALLGVLIGLSGTVFLIRPDTFGGHIHWGALLVLFLSTLSWSLGSILVRYTRVPVSAMKNTAMQMLIGGLLLLVVAVLMGEGQQLFETQVSGRSLLAIGYLIVFGSVIVFPVYQWLMRVSTPSMVGTHAYVNPVVAVILGWALASEPIGIGMLFSALMIVGSVWLITLDARKNAKLACPSRPVADWKPDPSSTCG